jgi:hypothetical protein
VTRPAQPDPFAGGGGKLLNEPLTNRTALQHEDICETGFRDQGGFMRKKLVPLAAFAVTALILSAVAAGGTHMTKMNFSAVLNAGQEVHPRPVGTKVGAAGKFTASVTGTKMTWKLTFSHLTGAATAAHIHAGKKGIAGAVLVPLCGGTPVCKSGLSGSATLTSAELTSMKAGATYVNVHTAKNPNGEIRGQLKVTM